MLIVTPLAVRTGFAFSFGNKTYSNINHQQFLYKIYDREIEDKKALKVQQPLQPVSLFTWA